MATFKFLGRKKKQDMPPDSRSKFFNRLSRARLFVFSATIVVGGFFLLAASVLAQVGNPLDTTIPTQLNIGTNTDLRMIIINIVRFILGFLGLLAVIIVMYAGYLWMTSAGNEKKIEQAKMILKNGLIGLVIILSAYLIVSWIINAYFTASNPGGPGDDVNGPCTNCAFLGGIIEDHYPPRNAKDIPRNTHLSITFSEPIFLADTSAPQTDQDKSLMKNAVQKGAQIPGEKAGVLCGVAWCGEVNLNIFKLAPTVDMLAMTKDSRVFMFYPKSYLG